MRKYQKIYWKILRPIVIVFLYFKFRYTFKLARNMPDNFIVLSNHNTDFDPLFLGVSFKDSIRFVASEHISRWKVAFKFVNHIFSPILRTKGVNGASTVKEMLRSLRGGDNVCIFAEGAKSWNGITAPILTSTGKVVKSSRCALVTYKITGGYFCSPIWSKSIRRGKIHGEVVNVYSAESVAKMSVDEINKIINRDLFEDAYDRQLLENNKYKGKCLAEKLESMLFCCPNCKAIDCLHSSGDTVFCKKCNSSFTYDEYGNISGLEQKNIKELFVFLRDKALSDSSNNVSYSSPLAKMIKIDNHIETVVSEGKLVLSKNEFVCGTKSLNIDDIEDFTMHGRSALLLSTKDAYYEVLVNEDTSALKFYMLYLAYKFGCVNRFNF